LDPAPSREDAFVSAVADHYPGLVRRLSAVLGDVEAGQDLAQEAYLRAYRAWDRFDGTDPRAWLHTIGLRLAFNERARRGRWRLLLLHDALGGLRPEHRAALLMTVVDGYTQAEVAAMLEVAPGTVASWVARAKSRLRESLTDD
jgi:RNA polymerase sigma-70 factor (ECF subfamily)